MKKFTPYCLLLTTLFLFLVAFSTLPPTIFAQEAPTLTEYRLLAPIPLDGAGSGDSATTNATTYLPGLVKLIIGIAGAIAVVKIMFGGIKYMSTDAFSGKNEAKDTIQNALWGLLLIIGAWLILYTINPKLVEFDLRIPIQETEGDLGTGTGELPNVPIVNLADCNNCIDIDVNNKGPGLACATNLGNSKCMINSILNTRLRTLITRGLPTTFGVLITEAFPPTRQHTRRCHYDGRCVDVTIGSNTSENIKNFIENARAAGLNAEFETISEERAALIRRATGLSTDQVKYIPGITGEHFSVYMN